MSQELSYKLQIFNLDGQLWAVKMEGSVYVETLSKDLFNVVLKKHEMDSKTVERDIDTILEWFETRPHLPRKFGKTKTYRKQFKTHEF